MRIDSPRFDAIEVDPDKIIEFPRGLPGFDHLHRYALFQPETAGEAPSHFILQSVDDPAVAFHIADPALFGFNYEITLSDEESAALRLADPAAAAVVVMLVKEDNGGVRANLNAPLVLNLDARLGAQHVFARLNYAVTLKGPQ